MGPQWVETSTRRSAMFFTAAPGLHFCRQKHNVPADGSFFNFFDNE
jgi:hypothetical protein